VRNPIVDAGMDDPRIEKRATDRGYRRERKNGRQCADMDMWQAAKDIRCSFVHRI
jgi:hypothetical protein